MSWLQLNTFSRRVCYQVKTNHYNNIIRFASATKKKSKNKQQTQYVSHLQPKKDQKKSKQKSKSSLYEAPSLSKYVVTDTSVTKDVGTGWNRTFSLCYQLLDWNPYGITSMMNILNVSLTATGSVLFGAIYCCSYYGIYTFPSAWLFSWMFIRIFSDLFPVFPKLYSHLIDNYAFHRYPILKYLYFSRKLPNPELQSLSSMVQERETEKKRVKNKKNRLAGKEETDTEDDITMTDELLATKSKIVSWKIRQRAGAKKYGLSWDIVENSSMLILMTLFSSSFYAIGLSDPLMDMLLQNENLISGFLLSNKWIVDVGISYSVATYFNRFVAIPIFRYYCVPRSFEKFGPYQY